LQRIYAYIVVKNNCK